MEGFDVKFIHADILHIYHLGTGRDLVGSALVHMLERRGIFEGSNIAARLASATLELRRFCKERKLPLKLHKLSRSKLNWNTADMPELRSSGYDTYVVNKWLVEVTTRHSAQLPAQLCTALWTADKILSTLAKAGRWLSVEEQELKECYGALFMRSYVELANSSLERRRRAYRLRPKLHLWHHILKESRPSRINPHVFSTWMDEDALRKMMKIHRITDKKTAQKRLLQRILLGLPGIWNAKQKAECLAGATTHPGYITAGETLFNSYI